jgi:hypothetical protein
MRYFRKYIYSDTSIIPLARFCDPAYDHYVNDMDEFVIDFTYEQMPFTGLVSPRHEGDNSVYSVKLESQNQELNLEIIANPCGDGKMEWCFKGEPNETDNYDPALLQEIGEAIEKYQTSLPTDAKDLGV